jgi:hypothetical protein
MFLQYLLFFLQNFICSFGQQFGNDFVYNSFGQINNSIVFFISGSASWSNGSGGGDSSAAVEDMN